VAALAAALVALLLPLVLGAASVDASTELVVRRDVDYGRSERLDAFLPPPGRAPVPAVLFIHGGGWRTGSKEAWDGRARDFAGRTGWATFSVEYDLDADQPYVTQPADVRAAIAWVRTNSASLGVDPLRIGLLGSSAGGHLAMLVATTATGADRVSAVVSWSGPSDLPLLDRSPVTEPRVKALAARYVRSPLEDEPQRWLESSPVAHVDRGDPPMLLVASEDESMVPVDQLTSMRDALATNGVEVRTTVLPGTRHASAFADDVWRESIQFLRDHV
jgi:acetyl esterase/lipase